MKKLLACVVLAAFAALTSAQAGESCTQKVSACAADTKAACPVAAKASCTADTAKTVSAKSCCASGKVAKKRVIVKGAVLLAQR